MESKFVYSLSRSVLLSLLLIFLAGCTTVTCNSGEKGKADSQQDNAMPITTKASVVPGK